MSPDFTYPFRGYESLDRGGAAWAISHPDDAPGLVVNSKPMKLMTGTHVSVGLSFTEVSERKGKV